MKFLITTFIGLVFLLFTGCSVKSPKSVEVTEEKRVAKEHQTDVRRLDYYKSMSAISRVTLQELDELIDGEPTAAGEYVLVLSAEATAQAITDELLKSFSDAQEGALPIVAHWNAGYPENTNGMDPDYMLSLIEDGLHVLPSWHLDPYWDDVVPQEYYKASILRAAALNLPLVFITTPFEEALLQDSTFSNKRGLRDPAVVDLNGDRIAELSPFALDRQWYNAGEYWAGSSILEKIQEWYPNPPLVMFVADKKASKLFWIYAEDSKRYMNAYSNNANYRDADFKRSVMSEAWKNKYSQLKNGFIDSLESNAWKESVKFVSYNEVPVAMGQRSSWAESATYSDESLSVWSETADAVVSEFHIDSNDGESASAVIGPHTRANNIEFIYNEARGVNPNFAKQLSLSDNWTMESPEEYRGFIQLALWLTRPSVIRESIDKSVDWIENGDDIKKYFQEIVDSVEMIHNNELLHQFWSQGILVANADYNGVNDNAIPSQYVNSNRWFLLDVDINPRQPWNTGDYINVWAVALSLGEAPNREWLLYVQSPEGDQENISVNVPGYKEVIVDSNKEGAFYVIEEAQSSTQTIATRTAALVPAVTPDTETDIEGTNPVEAPLVPKEAPAFYGAEGAGAIAVGGRGGRIIEVTNLNSDGPGSLREAVEAVGPRIVIFKVAGIINFDGRSLDIVNPYITIAGQSAPEGGITVRGQALEIGTHDVVIQYLKMRTGNELNPAEGADAVSVTDGAYNVIVDHCSISWSNDENIGMWSDENPMHDITWSWNLISEGLMHSTASCGLLTGSNTNTNDMRDITVQHNAFINFTHRLPLIKVKTAKVINNMIYNWSEWATGISGGVSVDIIGNKYKAGPLTGTNLTYLREIIVRTEQTIADEGWTGDPDFGPSGDPSIYIKNNVSTIRNISETGDDWPMISEWYWQRQWPDLDESKFRRSEELPQYKFPITQYGISEAESLILADSGASKRISAEGVWVSNRDSIDERVINNYKNGTGVIPNRESDVGGYVSVSLGTGYLDSDHDGMSDIYEDNNGFDKNSAADGNEDRDNDGFTNVEEFLNATDPDVQD
ncbi:MAG: hypothetical protein U9P71_02985 [Campylobacterota bacterium]|nr:hypothetical protein [Campylobacterota bacterium]